jgi:hypothetical protein
MTEASWQCPDPQCGGILDRHKGKRVAVDPRTDKKIGPSLDWGWVKFYRSSILLIGCLVGLLLWFGPGIVMEAIYLYQGRASSSPLATIIVIICLFAGMVVMTASEIISNKRLKAALARAVWYESYRCQRCRKWWMFPAADHLETTSVDGERQTEETPAG